MKPFVLGAIFARGGSKGIPGKNIKSFYGKPLIAYAIETAQKVSAIDHLIVSTDCPDIAHTARKYGADVPFLRPKSLATDNSPEILSWAHALDAMENILDKKIDILVSVPTTSPLRDPQDIEQCVKKLISSKCDCVITATKARRNPYFNMVTIDKDGRARLVNKAKNTIAGRQLAPSVYDMTTVAYAARSSYVRKTKNLFEGRVKAVLIPEERALDIDTLHDFQIAEYLMSRRHRKG